MEDPDGTHDVRSVQLAHETDNGFAGAAFINPLFEVFQFAHNRYGPSCVIDTDCTRARLGFDVYEDSDGVCKNALGLTPEGEILVQTLMDNGMLIDLAHLPERGILRTDLNAFTQNTRPRFIDRSLPGKPKQNPNSACSAGFRAEGICAASRV